MMMKNWIAFFPHLSSSHH